MTGVDATTGSDGGLPPLGPSSRVAVLGAGGQLGAALLGRLGEQALALPRAAFDLDGLTFARCETLTEHGVTHVVNCAAFNAVDACETDAELATKANAINVQAPGTLARWCRDRGLPLVHISTDYVFTDAPCEPPPHGWSEADRVTPLGVYASSKLVGETLAVEQDAIVVRTCGLYGRGYDDANVRRRGGNFVETMLRLADSNDGEKDNKKDNKKNNAVRVVSDQTCTPTACVDLAEWITALLAAGQPGLYHATNAGACTWAEFAAAIFQLADRPTRVVEITTEEFGAAAPRPYNSVLNCQKLDTTLGLKRRSWQDALAAYLDSRAAR